MASQAGRKELVFSKSRVEINHGIGKECPWSYSPHPSLSAGILDGLQFIVSSGTQTVPQPKASHSRGFWDDLNRFAADFKDGYFQSLLLDLFHAKKNEKRASSDPWRPSTGSEGESEPDTVERPIEIHARKTAQSTSPHDQKGKSSKGQFVNFAS